METCFGNTKNGGADMVAKGEDKEIEFGCIEKQANHQPHLHLAITNPMPPKFYLKAKKVLFKKLKKFSLFHESGTDLRLIGGDDADYWRIGDYLGKDGRLLTMGPAGVY